MVEKKRRVGIIGCGSLGSIVAEGITTLLQEDYQLVGVTARNREKAERLAKTVGTVPLDSVEELIKLAPDYIVEAASADIIREYGKEILEGGSHLVLLSTGAFADAELYQEIFQAAKKAGKQVYLAPGAIGGLDIMDALSLYTAPDVKITSVKPPRSLAGAPFLAGRILSEAHREVVFSGTVAEAIQGFPNNVNVAVTTALATKQMEQAKAEIISDPSLESNTHTITLESPTSKINIEIASIPSPKNPRSSSLAGWSVVALLKRIASPIVI